MQNSGRAAVTLCFLLALLIASRWLLAPKYLFFYDNINFALALEDFNPLKHQPHPPGYPLFVGLEKLIHLAIPSVKYTQLISGTIGSFIALAALWHLGDLLFGAPAGLFAAALLLFNPVFWLAGIGNHIRTFLAAGSTVIAICIWRAWHAEEPRRWFVYSALALGVAGGFRLELIPLLFPLWVSIPLRRRMPDRAKMAGLATLTAAILPWAAVLFLKTGGVEGIMSSFAHRTAQESALFGGPVSGALVMAILAIYWTGLGVLTWIWAVPFAWNRAIPPAPPAPKQLLFLTVWFLPSFAFHVFVHSDDPDHVLDIIPVTCLAGAWILAWIAQRANSPKAIPAIAAIVALLNAALFFLPPYRLGKEASYRFVRMTGDWLTEPADMIKTLDASGPVVVIMNHTYVTSRQIGYYFPGDPVLAVDANLAAGCPAGSATLTLHNQGRPVRMSADTIYLPSASRTILLLGGDSPPVSGYSFARRGGLLVADGVPPDFRIGACRFAGGG